MSQVATLEQWLGGLEPSARTAIDLLRQLVMSACPQLVESIKWNAPSFALNGEDRVTLGVERAIGTRLVLHRGARIQDAGGFRFDDPERLCRWPAQDRGIVRFNSPQDVAAISDKLQALVARWIAATARP